MNPDHLEIVTRSENAARAPIPTERRERDRCFQGHQYTPETLYIHPRTGSRVCRICSRASYNRHMARKKAERQAALAERLPDMGD